MQKITPFLWFNDQAEEAMNFYASVFKDSQAGTVNHYGEGAPMPAGTVMTASFKLLGLEFTALNGGPQYKFTEAVSFVINCDDQAEVDYYWDKLTEGGEEGQCGWLKDRFGLSWQVVPSGLAELLSDPDPGRAQRALTCMLKMTKLDLNAMKAAAEAE
jgi:predicted 3-demethylubiquinone-9 3-methyltransferase (glyoxalase superfamily)